MFRAQCSAGFGKNGKACSRCASSSCGVCAKDYKKCELKKTTCLKPDWTNWEPTGTKVAWNTDGYCNNAPGLSGTGYSSTFTPTIANGTCLDCASPSWRPNTHGHKFCDVLKQVNAAAATAVQEDAVNSGCKHPAGVKFPLERACITQKGSLPFFATYVFVADVCGMKITVAVELKGAYPAGAAARQVGMNPTPPKTTALYSSTQWAEEWEDGAP